MKVTDEQFFEMLCNKELWIFDDPYPLMPQEELQIKFTGAAGKETLIIGYDFWINVKNLIKKSLRKIKILDFGCGWGRITRFWVKDILRKNIFGVDPWSEMIDICRQSIAGVNFLVSKPEPPLEFTEQSFDIITAYSVFSHLNEDYTRKWFEEFSRLLKPGGILAITTRSRFFIEYCVTLKRHDILEGYANRLSQVFNDNGESLRKYDNGEFVHKALGGGGYYPMTFMVRVVYPFRILVSLVILRLFLLLNN